jgi:hypothetical protein
MACEDSARADASRTARSSRLMPSAPAGHSPSLIEPRADLVRQPSVASRVVTGATGQSGVVSAPLADKRGGAGGPNAFHGSITPGCALAHPSEQLLARSD